MRSSASGSTGTVLVAIAPALRRLVEVAVRAVGLRFEHLGGADLDDTVARTLPSLVVTDAARPSYTFDGTMVPVVAIVKGGVRPKLEALALGAADVVGIPFDLQELSVRIAAAIGRATGVYPKPAERFDLGPLQLDLERNQLHLNGTELKLSPLEQRIFLVLAANEGDVTPRDAILEAVWGPGMEPNSNLIDRHIRDLRRKLADDWRTPNYIVTVRGTGYSFRKAPREDTNARLD